jgi:hypothetical protein
MVKVHTEAGRGIKQCVCGAFIGVRNFVCPKCNHEFKKKEIVEVKARIKKIKLAEPQHVFDIPGKGRKQCKSCKKYVGLRSRICSNCSNPFPPIGEVKEKVKKNDNVEIIKEKDPWDNVDHELIKKFALAVGFKKGDVVLTPSGDCPTQLTAIDELAVTRFCDEIVNAGLDIDKLYTPKAIKYWGHWAVDFKKVECRMFDEAFEKWLKDVMVNYE